jgi:hypothetical protein
MNHLQNGACFFLIPNACLDMQKLRKSTQYDLILPHWLVPKMDKVESRWS